MPIRNRPEPPIRKVSSFYAFFPSASICNHYLFSSLQARLQHYAHTLNPKPESPIRCLYLLSLCQHQPLFILLLPSSATVHSHPCRQLIPMRHREMGRSASKRETSSKSWTRSRMVGHSLSGRGQIWEEICMIFEEAHYDCSTTFYSPTSSTLLQPISPFHFLQTYFPYLLFLPTLHHFLKTRLKPCP